jgi:hypothetical protein
LVGTTLSIHVPACVGLDSSLQDASFGVGIKVRP